MLVGDGEWPELGCINDGGGTVSQSERGHITFHDEYIRCDLEDDYLKKVLYITMTHKSKWPGHYTLYANFKGICVFFLIK